MTFIIRRATYDDKPEWLRMRHGLWPDAPLEYLALDLDGLLADEDTAVWMAFNENGQPVGFIEVGLRAYAEGCESSPVGYIEAWFVGELVRRAEAGPGPDPRRGRVGARARLHRDGLRYLAGE